MSKRLSGVVAAAFAAAALGGFALPASAVAAGPTAVATDSDGVVYAGFEGGGQIKRYQGSDGTPLSSWGTPGSNPGQLGGVVAIDVAPGAGSSVWVLDTNLRVQEFTRAGAYVRGTTLSACSGRTPDPRNRGGIDVTSNAIYIAHPCADSVLRLDRSNLGVTAITSVAGPKGVSAQLYDSAPASTKALYVARPAANQVVLLDRTTLMPMGTPQAVAGSPSDVFVDAFGVLFVADDTFDVIRMFGTDGAEFRTLGGPGTAAGQLDGPAAIDVFEQFSDLAGNIFIADYGNKRVQRWNPFGFTFWAMPADGAAPGPQAPVNTAKPQILGTAAVGQSLTCTDGTWSNNPTSFTRAWARDGSAIPGASGSQYTVVGADAGRALTCTVTATNAAGSGQATSNPRSIPAGSPPVNSTLPQISGNATVGQTISCSQGTWQNNPTSFAYEWRRNGAPIGGASQSTYSLVAADGGQQIRCAVTATNGAGSTTAVSGAVVPAQGQAPVSVTPPQINGTPTVGQTLTCSEGTWQNGPTSFAYQWRRGSNPIAGATTSSYALVAADANRLIRCAVTATNAVGSTTALSATVTPGPAPQPPVNVAPPVIGGETIAGEQLTCSQGSWSNSPTAFAYSWQRNGNEIATGPNYVLVNADVGNSVTCAVRASNNAGAATAVSDGVVIGSAGTNPVGISIAAGAGFVNTPNVTLTIHEPRGTTALTIANDGGFAGASKRALTGNDQYSWQLDASVQGKLPKTVYVRFEGPGVDPIQTYSDDVVLDQVAPKSATPRILGRGKKLKLKAFDDNSGVATVDLATGGGDNYTSRAYFPVMKGGLGGVIFVRPVDAAGNPGKWKRVKYGRKRGNH